MIPNLSPAGRSFKGAFAYHMHDKGKAETSERVAWSSARNLMTDDARTAERVMIATAKDADRLKEQAGIKSTGRKSVSPVQTFSLSWHPGEVVSREDMERAVDGALKELGLEDHQAYIAAHTDRPHPHVHVIVNRVNPQDGRMATLSNSKRILDRWAHSYEVERGQIVTPNRAEKYARKEQAQKRYSPEERRAYMERKRQEERQDTDKRREVIKAEPARDVQGAKRALEKEGQQANRVQLLKDLHAVLKEEHKAEREELWKAQRAEWSKITSVVGETWKRRKNERQNKLEFRDLAKRQFKAEKVREKLEKSATGRLSLSIMAARIQLRTMKEKGEKAPAFAKLVWVNLLNKDVRTQVFNDVKKAERAKLNREQYERFRPEAKALLDAREKEFSALKARYDANRKELQERQKNDREYLYQAWREGRAEGLIYSKEEQAKDRDPMPQGVPDDRPRVQAEPTPQPEKTPASYAQLERLAQLQRKQDQLQRSETVAPRVHGNFDVELDPGSALKRLRADREQRQRGEHLQKNERELRKTRRDTERDR